MSILQAKNGGLVTTNVNDICFEVEKTPLSDLGFGSISSTEYGIVANIQGQKTILNTCSDRYELISNDQIFLVIENLLNASDISFNATYEMHDYSVFKAQYNLNDCYVTLPNNDKMYLKFEVTHSYNGLAQYSIILGYFRLVCSNGLVVPLEDALYIKGKHTNKILESVENLITHLESFMDKKDKYAERFEIMADRPVKNWHERIEAVMNATSIHAGKKDVNKLAIHAKMEIELNDRIGTGNKVYANDWLIYNAINEGYIYNDSVNSIKPHLRIEKDAKLVQWIYEHPAN